ncbi:MAG TPA: hypothetical protein VKU60_15475, partial [Chloroflexota bacterium]|nr:hypothetical protein [Chloroflexota bacterium]
MVTSPGEGQRQVFDTFQKTFGISVELLIGQGSEDVVPRLDRERQAGQFLWERGCQQPGGTLARAQA